MVARRSETVAASRVDPTGRTPFDDELAVEAPLEIRLDGVVVATTMRTPGDDVELAAGFCHGDGLLGGAAIVGVDNGLGPDAIGISTGGAAPPPVRRLGITSTSCGMCGSTVIEEITARLTPLPRARLAVIDDAVIAAIPAAVRRAQALFASTGAVHAAAAFRAGGSVELVREDVGRHNALDKVVGRLLLDGRLPAHDLGVFVSGRASFELVAKAWAAGFGTLVAVSAPTALAVSTARAAGITLAGFTRAGRFNLYTP